LHGSTLATASGADDFDSYRDRGLFPTVEQVCTMAVCRIGTSVDVPVSFGLWGDSHAEALPGAVSSAAASRGRRGLLTVRRGA
jgi:hypothetical protein